MDEIKHYWDSIKYLSKFNTETANNYQMYLVQCCRRKSLIELPKQNFGSSIMCSHCGSFWTQNRPQVRIISGKNPSKSVRKIIKSSMEENKISKFCATLMKKSLKSEIKKISVKCSVCLKNTQISCPKIKKIKPEKEKLTDISLQKKKKKRKDKMAGLNLSLLKTPKIEEEIHLNSPSVTTPLTVKIKKSKNQEINPSIKTRKLNTNKLNNVINNSNCKKSRKSLNNFLKELY